MVFGLFKKKKSIYKPFLASNSVNHMQELFKGKKFQTKYKFPSELGVEHSFDIGIIQNLVKKVPIVSGAVNKYVDFIVAPGFYVESKNEKAKAIIDSFIEANNFNVFLRHWIKDGIMGTGYAELDFSETATNNLQTLDPRYMYIDRTDKGKIIGYNQCMQSNKIDFSKDVTNFKPNEIAHISINKIGDSPYGYGLVFPALSAINNIIGSEKDLHMLMNRKANTPYHVKVGDTIDNIPSQSDLEDISQKFEWLNNKHEWVTDALTEIKGVDFGNIGEKFEFVLNHDIQMFLFGMQIPAVIMGMANVPEGLAKAQLEAFDRNIKSLQNEIEKVVEEKIFRVILQQAGIDAHVEMVWGQPSKDERNSDIKMLTELLKNPMLNPLLAEQLELKLANLLDIDTKQLETNDEERDREQDESLPPLRQPSESFNCCNVHKPLKSETMENFYGGEMTINEWVNVNFSEYKKKILDYIKTNKFRTLAASTVEDVKAGLLVPRQIDSLRSVLKDGFENNVSIRDMSRRILDEVSPPPRYKMKNGKMVKNKDGKPIKVSNPVNRSLNIARTETINAANAGRQAYYKDKGVEKVRWVAAYSDRTCDVCLGMDGQIFEVGKAPNILHPLCRCSTVPIVDLK